MTLLQELLMIPCDIGDLTIAAYQARHEDEFET
jgi:hypothetical protein